MVCGQSQQSPLEAFLRAILRQLVESALALRGTFELVEHLRSSVTHTLDMSAEALKAQILAEVARFNHVFLLIDALDQCPEDAQDIIRHELVQLLQGEPSVVRIMMSQSRPDIPPLQLINCNQEGCVTDPVVLYWHCASCNNGDFHLCQDCFDKGFYCTDR